VKLPVYFARKQRYGEEEAEARLLEARQTYQATHREAEYLVKQQYLIAKSSERILALNQSGIAPQAGLALESTLSAYEVGNTDFLTLINSATGLLNVQRQYYEELARHEQALARLESLVGTDLLQ
jgi:outer membrane protein TolC